MIGASAVSSEPACASVNPRCTATPALLVLPDETNTPSPPTIISPPPTEQEQYIGMAPRNKPSEKKSSSAENDHLPPEHGGHLRQMLDDVIHGALRPPSQHTTEEPSPEPPPETSLAPTHKTTVLPTPTQAAAPSNPEDRSVGKAS